MSFSSPQMMGTPDGLYHWIPGEMVVVVRLPRLPADDTHDLLVEQIRIQLNECLSRYGLSLELYGTYGRWSNAPTMPPIRRRAFFFGLRRKRPLIAIFFHVRHNDTSITDPMPMALAYVQSNLERLARIGLFVVSAMPNWLLAAAPAYYASDSGPAVPPRPSPTLDVPAAVNALLGWHITLADQTIPLDAKGAEDVLVAVLDTAPHPDRVRSAATRPEMRRHWLLQRLAQDLRNEDGSFSIEYDRYMLTNDVRTGRDYMYDARYYLMPDHGLSVAGLIRDIAPKAQIRLIRILNDYGGGDLYGLFAALTDLERELVTGTVRRLVINLSLTIMPDVRRLPYIWFDHRQWPTTQISNAARVLSHIEEGLRLLFDGLLAHGALTIAAAGNDSLMASQQGRHPRPPRAPARYESTLSASSVNSKFEPSAFANMANIPPIDSGVATFGGDSYGAMDANSLPDAVRGVYIAPSFPDGEQNLSGWADWCGTSFSAAIMSGLGAHLMAQGYTASNSITRLASGRDQQSDMLFGAVPDARKLLANVLRIQQSFGL